MAEVIKPAEERRPLYDELFELYGQLYAQTRDIVHRLYGLAEEHC